MSITLKFVDRYAGGNPSLRQAAEALLAGLGKAWRASGGRPRPERYVMLYELADAELAAVKKRLQAPIPCVQGCSHCCRFNEILLSKWQAVVLVRAIEALPAETREAVVARILTTRSRSGGGLKGPCALLSPQGRCSAYAGRPLPCRGYYSLSEPACRQRLEGEGRDPPTFVAMRLIELAALDAVSADESAEDRAPMELNSLLRRIYSDPDRLAQWAAGQPSDEADLVAWPGRKSPPGPAR
jgi:Putative zinc- or iron-chelating domain